MSGLVNRLFIAGVVLALVTDSCATCQVEAPPAAKPKVDAGHAALARALEKRGGVKALRAIRDYEVVMKGQASTGGGAMAKIEVRRKVLLGTPPCLHAETQIEMGETRLRDVIVLKGDRGTRRTSFAGGAFTREQVAVEWAKLHCSDLFILRAGLDPKIPVDHLGDGKVGEIETESIRVRRPGDAARTVDLDKATGRVLRITWKERSRRGEPPQPMEIRYADFRPLGDLTDVPRKAEVRLAGKVVQTRVTTEWKVNVGLKAEAFEVGEE